MSNNEIHVGDQATVFTITLYDGTSAVDISGATGKAFVFTSPDGTTSTITVNFVGGGTAGSLVYTTTASTFSNEGLWKMQAVVTFATSKFHSDIHQFVVYPNL